MATKTTDGHLVEVLLFADAQVRADARRVLKVEVAITVVAVAGLALLASWFPPGAPPPAPSHVPAGGAAPAPAPASAVVLVPAPCPTSSRRPRFDRVELDYHRARLASGEVSVSAGATHNNINVVEMTP